jgi:hypothetical protein
MAPPSAPCFKEVHLSKSSMFQRGVIPSNARNPRTVPLSSDAPESLRPQVVGCCRVPHIRPPLANVGCSPPKEKPPPKARPLQQFIKTSGALINRFLSSRALVFVQPGTCFERARLQPCHTKRSFHAALAAEAKPGCPTFAAAFAAKVGRPIHTTALWHGHADRRTYPVAPRDCHRVAACRGRAAAAAAA